MITNINGNELLQLLTAQDFNITEAEWEVMRVVCTLEKVTSNEISEILQEKQGWKSTTAKTFIGRLEKMGC